MGVFNRLGAAVGKPQPQTPYSSSNPHMETTMKKVCIHWRAGRCTRNPCLFLHKEFPIPPRAAAHHDNKSSSVRKPNPNFSSKPLKWVRGQEVEQKKPTPAPDPAPDPDPAPAPADDDDHKNKVCQYWIQGKCRQGDKCKYLHQWFKSDCFALLTQLPGHDKVVTAIALPSGSDKLFSGSKDKSLKAWDCNTGQCAGVLDLGGEVGCIKSEGSWVFVGTPNLVRAWKIGTSVVDMISLTASGGQVYAFEFGFGMVFAGMQDGSILSWKLNEESSSIDSTCSLLKGHTGGVVSLIVGGSTLYSGSVDCTIKSWDLSTLQCVHTLTDHTDVVTSVLCWTDYLLSCSLDQTIKVWGGTESGGLELVYTHKEEHGVVTLCGMHDAEDKPLLVCSCNNNTVSMYDLPTFNLRGKIFSKEEVRAIQFGPGGLFFTGDGAGELKVWKLSEAAPAAV